MKILIADDDKVTRAVLSTVLREQFSLTPLETEDGVQTLQTIRDDPPDVVLLDLGMPNMTGLEVLKAVRAEAALGALPVVVISGSRDHADVKEAIGLGVLDYLIKPLHLRTLRDRLNKSIGSIARHRQTTTAPEARRPTKALDADAPRVLLVDRDVDFRQFFGGLFDDEGVQVETRALATDAVTTFAQRRPSMVLVGERLENTDARSLARTIREMDPSRRTLIYLCAAADRLSAADTAIFDGLIHRSFMSESVRREVMQVFSPSGPAGARTLAHELPAALLHAIREAVDTMTHQGVTVLDVASAGIPREVAIRVQLVADGPTRAPIELEFSGGVRDIEHYAELVRGAPTSVHRGGASVFQELASTTAGHLVPLLGARGIAMRVHFAAVLSPLGSPRTWDVRTAFETAGPCRVHVGVVLDDKGPRPHVPRVIPRVL